MNAKKLDAAKAMESISIAAARAERIAVGSTSNDWQHKQHENSGRNHEYHRNCHPASHAYSLGVLPYLCQTKSRCSTACVLVPGI